MRKFLILLTFLQFTSHGQNFGNCYKGGFLAESYIKQGEFKKALGIYDTLVKKHPNAFNIYHEYAILLFKNKEYSKSSIYFLKLAKLGYLIEDLIYDDYGNGFEFNIDDYLTLKKSIPNFESLYIQELKKTTSQYNYEYNLSLLEILELDQIVRYSYIDLKNSNCQTYDSLYNIHLEKSDSLNFLKLKNIISKFGYPTIKSCSFVGIKAFFLCLTHNSTNKFFYNDCNKMLEYIKSQFNISYFVSPVVYANIIDRRHMHIEKTNYYCQLYDRDFPIKELSSLDIRRNEIYLLPISIERPRLKLK